MSLNIKFTLKQIDKNRGLFSCWNFRFCGKKWGRRLKCSLMSKPCVHHQLQHKSLQMLMIPCLSHLICRCLLFSPSTSFSPNKVKYINIETERTFFLLTVVSHEQVTYDQEQNLSGKKKEMYIQAFKRQMSTVVYFYHEQCTISRAKLCKD